MAEATADWVWQDLQAERSTLEIGPAHIAAIRKLVVFWETAESGAAALATPDLEPLSETADDALRAACEVFMAKAVLPSTAGVIINPYARQPGAAGSLLQQVPDPAVAALFSAGADIPFKATPEDLLLWAEASLGAGGIDPKRPFGTTNVPRDIRAIIDPDKTLSAASFGKRRRTLESRLMLLLQFFVQQAELAPGLYQRDSTWQWLRLQPGVMVPAERLTRAEWIHRSHAQISYECGDYTTTARCLAHLIWENRLTGGYAAICAQFQLETHFDNPGRARYAGSHEDRLRHALRHFPETRRTTERPWFTLTLARILNAKARYAEARAVLQAADLLIIAPEDADLSAITTLGVAFLEGLILRVGLGEIGEEEFQSILAGSHSAWRTKAGLWDFVWRVLYEPDRIDSRADYLGDPHVGALSGQIQMMRGGYDPDQVIRQF